MGSDMPEGATPTMQADAFDALLDAIGVEEVVVVAGSAGTHRPSTSRSATQTGCAR